MGGRLRWPAVVAAVALSACGGGGSKSLDLTAKDSGSTVEVHPGDVVSVTLDANHTTPYHWVLTQAPDPKVVRSLGSDYRSEGGGVGSGGVEVWMFRAVSAGSTSLALAYESLEASPTGQRFSLDVHVVSPG